MGPECCGLPRPLDAVQHAFAGKKEAKEGGKSARDGEDEFVGERYGRDIHNANTDVHGDPSRKLA
jgi:hypothetical protein